MGYAAVIPAYNCERTIAEVVKRAGRIVDSIVVVDDGSIDLTSEEALQTEARVITLERNKGKANAIRVGIRECRGFDGVVLLDADLQHHPEEIPRLLEGLERGAHLCIGSRFLECSMNMPLKNRLSNKFASTMLSSITGVRISDPQSGFRALDGEMAQNLKLKAERYAIEHVMILEAAKKNFEIMEVPISCVYGEESSQIKIFRDSLRVAYDITRFFLG